MSELTRSPAWHALEAHAQTARQLSMRHLFDEDPGRFDRYRLPVGQLMIDWSKHLVTEATWQLLLALGRQQGLEIGRAHV